MQAIALYRVSTQRQSIEGHSLDAQEERVGRAAKFLDVKIVRSWRIDASSKAGKNVGRTDLKEALQFCRTHKQIKYFIIDEVDRFMRSIDEYFWFKQEFKMLHVKLIFASQPELGENGQFAKLKELLAIYEAEASNEERSRKTTDKMKARVAAGYYPFYPRQGYKKSETPGLHVPDLKRFKLLQQALRSVAALEMTPKQAQQWLYSGGYRTPGGKNLDMNHWSRILRDPYYAGILQVKGWEPSTGLHQAMISRNEFQVNVEVITGRKVRQKRKTNPDFPLNLAFHEPCVQHNGKLTGINHTNGKGWSRKEYVCRTCKKRIARDEVHKSFTDLLFTLQPSEKHLNLLREEFSVTWKKQESHRIEHTKRLQLRLEELEQAKSRLIRGIATHSDLAEDFKQELVGLKTEISQTKLEIAGTKQVDQEFIEFTEYALNYTRNIAEKWWDLPPEKQNECKQLLFQGEILVSQDGNVYTPKLSPIYSLFNAKSSPKAAQNGNMVELVGTAPTSASLSS